MTLESFSRFRSFKIMLDLWDGLSWIPSISILTTTIFWQMLRILHVKLPKSQSIYPLTMMKVLEKSFWRLIISFRENKICWIPSQNWQSKTFRIGSRREWMVHKGSVPGSSRCRKGKRIDSTSRVRQPSSLSRICKFNSKTDNAVDQYHNK